MRYVPVRGPGRCSCGTISGMTPLRVTFPDPGTCSGTCILRGREGIRDTKRREISSSERPIYMRDMGASGPQTERFPREACRRACTPWALARRRHIPGKLRD